MPKLLVLDDFRAFMKSVVVDLDTPSQEKFFDAEDAVTHECGYGGRIDGIDTYRFNYITADGHHRWDVIVREAQIRDIADGLLIEVEGDRFDIVRTQRRAPVGEPLLIWGEYADDGLRVHSDAELLAALDAVHAWAQVTPRMLRMWSAADDQLVAVAWGEHCALYIIESADGYATSTGNQERNDSFEVLDHEGSKLTVPWADCVSWDYARRAVVWFLEHSDLGNIPVEGRIPSLLLMMGDVDRKAALSARSATPRSLAASSLARLAGAIPVDAVDDPTSRVQLHVEPPLDRVESAAWGRRLLDGLRAQELVDLGRDFNLDAISDQFADLVHAHALEAMRSLSNADQLVTKISAVPGIARLFATGSELQVVLRRSRAIR